ncbi:MAG TPA: GEVED domain-containing protein, partial [Methylomirabilota bacterium]|nr:GEVED domain-containing protein [Methylomirabilota bacterium]
MKRILCLLSLLLTSASLTQAFTLCYLWEDKFHQPVGSTLAGQPGGTGTLWESVGPSGPGIQVVAGGLAVPGLPVPEGNRVRLAGLNGPGARAALGSNVTSGTLYYSLALRVADRGTLGPEGGVLAAFNNATGASQTLPAPLAARLLVRSSGGGYQIGLSKSSANGADFVWASPTFSTNDIVFVVAGYEFRDGADTAFLWLNPPATSFGQSNAPPPTLTSSAGVDVANLQSFVLLQRPQPIHPAVTWVDEARVGTIWASVTPPPWDQFCTDFAQGLPAGTTATGTTPPAVVDGALHLTDAVNEQANYWTTRLTRQRVQSVSARWRTLIGGGTAPGADGLSFNLGYELGTAFLPEEGAGHGLSVSIDTWENASQEVGLEIKWNGQRVGFTRVGDGTTSAQAPLRSNQWVETELSVSPAGQVVFRYAGFSVAAQLPDYSGIDANEYAFAARTGGANDRHWIDDFCIRLTAGVCLDFATGLPAGTTAGGPNPPVVAAGVLHLTQALNDQSGYWITPVSRRIIQSASARWQALIGGGTTPGADGMSFNLGRDLGTSFVAEEGAVFGLSANVDTWDNGNGEVGIELKWNGQRIGFTRVGNGTTAAQAPLRPNQWVEAGLTLSPSGEATFRYADWSVSAQIPNYAGIDVDQYVFAARTGGANDRHCIDNFCLRLDERPQADLQVTLAPLPAQMAEGELLTITATASNAGPSTATRAEVTFSIPTGATLQSVTNDHGSCTVQGSNVTCTVNMLAAQQSFRVEAVAGVGPQFGGQTGAEFFDILIDISLTASEQDPNLDNNQVAVAVVVVPNLDFGDARAGYPVTRAENGARHRNGAIWRLGGAFDREPNGTHSANADYDDLTAVPDDEDGVTLPVPFLAGRTHTVMVTVPVAGMLDAFFDWNNDGDWLDAGERVTPPAGLPIGPGAVPVPIAVPLAAVNGSPHARFRFSDAGGLAPTGFHPVGEVEDYPVEVRRVDFGNAPDPSYPTLLANNGARHLYDPAWFMGALIDWEPDGPDSAPLVDEDGVVFAGPLVAGLPATVQVTASAAGFVDAFIDFNGDGDWLDAGERITPVGGTPVVAGPNPIPFTVP